MHNRDWSRHEPRWHSRLLTRWHAHDDACVARSYASGTRCHASSGSGNGSVEQLRAAAGPSRRATPKGGCCASSHGRCCRQLCTTSTDDANGPDASAGTSSRELCTSAAANHHTGGTTNANAASNDDSHAVKLCAASSSHATHPGDDAAACHDANASSTSHDATCHNHLELRATTSSTSSGHNKQLYPPTCTCGANSHHDNHHQRC
mmetsp:Transcript_48045/g.88494  ORF Transcript_48045/g.88494 Transcript_48045/m.88494 type:complete len:206 (+) Transcript_48045:388-1005(+)